jgi:hypothetical protein
MNISLENLELIPKLLQEIKVLKLNNTSFIKKRWLNTNELADYTGYKLETIKAKVKRGDFILGVHYYKRDGKLLFDKPEVDNWVMGIEASDREAKTDYSNVVNEVLSSYAS